jgi:hypothetical protein
MFKHLKTFDAIEKYFIMHICLTIILLIALWVGHLNVGVLNLICKCKAQGFIGICVLKSKTYPCVTL